MAVAYPQRRSRLGRLIRDHLPADTRRLQVVETLVPRDAQQPRPEIPPL